LYPFWRRAGLIPVLVLPLLVFLPASAAAAGNGAAFQRDRTPLSAKLTGSGKAEESGSAADPVSGGATIRMLVGLAIVLVVIYGLYRLMKRSASKGEQPIQGDDWMTILASTPLAPSRSIHLVRVGDEVVLVGAGEQGVTPIRVYTAEEARRLRIEPPAPLTPAFNAQRSGDEPHPGFFEALVESLKKKTAR
jgi:flagellar protein FliO/FliZ